MRYSKAAIATEIALCYIGRSLFLVGATDGHFF